MRSFLAIRTWYKNVGLILSKREQEVHGLLNEQLWKWEA